MLVILKVWDSYLQTHLLQGWCISQNDFLSVRASCRTSGTHTSGQQSWQAYDVQSGCCFSKSILKTIKKNDLPSVVQWERVTEDDGAKEAFKQWNTGHVVAHISGKSSPNQENERNVETALKSNHRIGPHIGKVDSFALKAQQVSIQQVISFLFALINTCSVALNILLKTSW